MRNIIGITLVSMLVNSAAGVMLIDTASLPTGTVDAAYSATLAASGGTPPYSWNVRMGYEETITNAFPSGELLQPGWNSDASAWQLDLPFAFPLYGVCHTQCWVSSEGYIHFGGPFVSENPEESTLATNCMITAVWTVIEPALPGTEYEVPIAVYLMTNDNQCVVRWIGSNMMGGYVNVAVMFGADGVVRVDPGNEYFMLPPVIGVSSGNGTDYCVSAADLFNLWNEYIQFSPTNGLPRGLCLNGAEIKGYSSTACTTEVSFVVQDSTDAMAVKSLDLVINEVVNELPVINSTDPVEGSVIMNVGGSQAFSVSASDPESEPLAYQWLWDGEEVGSDASSFTRISDWADHGLHTLRVNVGDDLWTNGEVHVDWVVDVRYADSGLSNLWVWSVMDAFGGRSAAGSFSNLSAVAQPGGVGVHTGGSFTHYAGFLGGVTMRSELNTDGDLLCDEIDPDNDNDQLTDLQERSGEAFDPVTTTYLNRSDSDGDGAHDGDEAVAGTNPLDENSLLLITGIGLFGESALISWSARGGVEYELRAYDSMDGEGEQVITNIAVTGGSAPWFETSADAEDAEPVPAVRRFYRIRVVE